MSVIWKKSTIGIFIVAILLSCMNLSEVQASKDTSKPLINYLVVDSSYVEISEVQKIVIGVGDGTQKVTNAELKYKNTTSGKFYTVKADAVEDGVAVFSIPYNETSLKGIYKLTGLSYNFGTNMETVVFDKIGMDISYGVGQAVTTNPDAQVVNPDADAVTMDIVTFDENGNQASQNSIEEALQKSAKDSKLNASRYNNNGVLVVMLDPGHDKTHAGAGGNGLREEILNLKIAQYCKAELEKYAGVRIYMSRSDDGTCPYPGTTSTFCNANRVDHAKSVGANAYVSLHLNSSTSSNPAGAEVYYPNQNYNSAIGTQGKQLAQTILNKLVNLGIADRGVKFQYSGDNTLYPDGSLADYYGVIRRSKEAGIPGIIVEHAFLSSASDANNYLKSEESLKKLGIADAQGIAEYFNLSGEGIAYYSSVFDASYYAAAYADLAVAYGNDTLALLQHFVNSGMQEGRQGNANFDVHSYAKQYADLRGAYGNDLKSYYLHYMHNGKAEGRKGTGCKSVVGARTVYQGVDYAAVYDYSYYTSVYADIKNAYGYNDTLTLAHFATSGMSEGRQGAKGFNVKSYRNQYADLRNAFGSNIPSYYLHFINNGKREGRVGIGCNTLQGAASIYQGIDYSAVYDFNYYISTYADIRNVYGNDEFLALAHFVKDGMREGRQGRKEFNVGSYHNQYPDLRKAFGKNLISYYNHYISDGKREGRASTGCSTLQGGITVYNGVDYAAVYNFNYYLSTYADIRNAFGNDEVAVLAHFVNNGMGEGRQGHKEFEISFYKNNHLDLQNAFGENLKHYYDHYVMHGQREGRLGTLQK